MIKTFISKKGKQQSEIISFALFGNDITQKLQSANISCKIGNPPQLSLEFGGPYLVFGHY